MTTAPWPPRREARVLAVMDAVAAYYRTANANTHGAFATSQRTDAVIAEGRAALADFLNARSANEIVFGPNMTTLTFNLSRALGRALQSGDEIIVTHLEHHANIGPWQQLAAEMAHLKFREGIPIRDPGQREHVLGRAFDRAVESKVDPVSVQRIFGILVEMSEERQQECMGDGNLP